MNWWRHRSRRDEAMVCYNELGCFRDEGPFSYLDLLPAPPEEINTRFFLYTPRNKDAAYQLIYNNGSTIVTSPYNASLPTKVMIHGFGSSCQRIWAKEMRNALISVVSRSLRRFIIRYSMPWPLFYIQNYACLETSIVEFYLPPFHHYFSFIINFHPFHI